eukprot:scaffold134_cov111-Isochrysis_galbana.AAC.1
MPCAGEQAAVRGGGAGAVPASAAGRPASARVRHRRGGVPADPRRRGWAEQPERSCVWRVRCRQDRVCQDYDAVPGHSQQERRPQQSGAAGEAAGKHTRPPTDQRGRWSRHTAKAQTVALPVHFTWPAATPRGPSPG